MRATHSCRSSMRTQTSPLFSGRLWHRLPTPARRGWRVRPRAALRPGGDALGFGYCERDVPERSMTDGGLDLPATGACPRLVAIGRPRRLKHATARPSHGLELSPLAVELGLGDSPWTPTWKGGRHATAGACARWVSPACSVSAGARAPAGRPRPRQWRCATSRASRAHGPALLTIAGDGTRTTRPTAAPTSRTTQRFTASVGD
jgi:hypothetical protein